MGTYKVEHDYESYRDGLRYGPWAEGDLVNLDDSDAEWVVRDSPGALKKVADKKPAAGPAGPVPAAGAQPRVGGDPDRAEAAAAAQELVHAEARARQAPAGFADEPPAVVEPLAAVDDPPARQRRGGRNRGD